MTFPEIFEKFKNHSYIRRKTWHKDVFIQYRVSAELIRLVQMREGLSPFVIANDTRMTASDLLADDWVDISEVED